MESYKLLTLSTILALTLSPAQIWGRRSKRQAVSNIPCVFTPINNQSFVEDIYPFFDEDSDTRILEYHISIQNVSGDFDFTAQSGPEAFQPWRWFRTQGVGSSQLLLVYWYYYGLLKPYMALGIDKRKVTLAVSPSDCLTTLREGQLQEMLRDYLLKDFNIDETSVDEPFTYSEDVEICTASLENDDGWGRLVYKCCDLDDEGRLNCHDVFEDAWVWVLRTFVIILTILLFLYFPKLIPKGYRIYPYVYYPPDNLKFNFRLTKNPEAFRNIPRAQILQPKYWKKMRKFQAEASKLQTDTTYTGHVYRVDFKVGMDRLLEEGGRAVHVGKSLFDSLIRCKIRHNDPLEDCCNTQACGVFCCHKCPPWHSWLRAVRTIVVMIVLALPSLPFMYAISYQGLDYQELADACEERDLRKSFNFYVGATFGGIVVAVLVVMYVFHTIILVIDGGTDGNISRLYTEILDVAEKKGTIRRRVVKAQNLVEKVFKPVKIFGVCILPIWLVGLAFVPVILLINLFYNAPVIRLVIQAIKRLLRRANILEKQPADNVRFLHFCEIYWFFITFCFVAIVLTIGANFLVHCVAMIIVKVLVDAQLVYRVLPTCLLLILYVRDSFSRVGQKYDTFLGTVLGTIKNKEAEDLRRECLKTWSEQQNKIFKIEPESIPIDEDDEVVVPGNKGYATMVNIESSDAAEKKKNLFLIKNGNVRLHLQQLLLFLNRDDHLFTSRKFLFHCCLMDCAGAPGVLEDNYIHATLDFLKIGIFLMFVFFVVMAYGNAYFISPTNQMFVTLISGLIPLVLRNLFLKRDAVDTVDTSNYRFEAQLKEKIETFSQSWDVEDIILDKIDVEDTDSTVPLKSFDDKGQAAPNSQFNIYPSTTINKDIVDLVLDVSGEYPDATNVRRNDRPKPGISKSGKVGAISCLSCKTNDIDENLGSNNKPRPYDDNGVDRDVEAESNNLGPRTHEGRWRRFNDYDNERHRSRLRREHENNTNSILADLDTYLVSNAIFSTLGLSPDITDSTDTSTRRSSTARRSRNEEPDDHTVSTVANSVVLSGDGYGGLESRAMGGLDGRGGINPSGIGGNFNTENFADATGGRGGLSTDGGDAETHN